MKKKLRCLQISNESFTAFKFLLPLAKYLNENGIETEIACSDKEYEDARSFVEDIKKEGVKWHCLPLERQIAPFSDLVSLIKLILFFKKEKFDIVHTQTSKAGILGRIAARIAGVPIVVHFTYDYAFTESTGIMKKSLFITLEKLAAFFSNRIYFLAESEMNKCFHYRIASPGKIICVGPVGLDLKEFNPNKISVDDKARIKEKYMINCQGPLVGTVARLVPHKGVDIFIKAAAEAIKSHPDCNFIIVGGGPLLEELKILSQNLGINEKIIFTGSSMSNQMFRW